MSSSSKLPVWCVRATPARPIWLRVSMQELRPRTRGMQKISEPPLKKCPHCCKSQLQRLMSAPVFRLKGGGWYETDFKDDKDKKRNLAEQPEIEAPKDALTKADVKVDASADMPSDLNNAKHKAADKSVDKKADANAKPTKKSSNALGKRTVRKAAKRSKKR
jgi:putative FmdB family regulatory protein